VADRDKVNQILEAAFAPAINDVSAHLDPSVNPGLPAALASWGYASEFQAVEAWREEAYRNAEALASAPNAAARAVITQQIEQNAAVSATVIRDATAYAPLSNSASRDAFCAANHG
jgi:hypothetical protein